MEKIYLNVVTGRDTSDIYSLPDLRINNQYYIYDPDDIVEIKCKKLDNNTHYCGGIRFKPKTKSYIVYIDVYNAFKSRGLKTYYKRIKLTPKQLERKLVYDVLKALHLT